MKSMQGTAGCSGRLTLVAQTSTIKCFNYDGFGTVNTLHDRIVDFVRQIPSNKTVR